MTFGIHAIHLAAHLNMMSGLMKDLHLAEHIDRHVPVDSRCQTKVSDLVQLLMLDILSGRQALVHLESWAAELDLDLLIRPGLQAKLFHDDTVARHLDRLSEAGIHHIVSSFFSELYTKEGISARILHGDTTSHSVYGNYAPRAEEDLAIVEGYSRDRPGAKQFQYGLIGNAEGIPLFGDVHDGNTSDKTWNQDTMARLQQQVARVHPDSSYLYIADSAAMTEKTLREIRTVGAHLITRAPNQLKMVKTALLAADQPETVWSAPVSFIEKKGATYRFFTQQARFAEFPLTLVVVESSALHERKAKTLQQKKEAEAAELQAAIRAESKQVYACAPDAEKAAAACRKHLRPAFHTLDIAVVPVERAIKKRGRPKKEEAPKMETVYHLDLQIAVDEAAWDTARRRASRFVLATTLPDTWNEEQVTAEKILGWYKGQIQVEMNFSFLKDPLVTDEIYVKTPARVEVLGYLFLLALSLYKVMQRRLRQVITPDRPIRGAGGRTLIKPTARAVFQLFRYLQIVVIRAPDGTLHRQFAKPLTKEQQQILTGLGWTEQLYLGS